jgi:class 3 adenylate cyclase
MTIVCAACGHENADDARFCSGCGAALAPAEPAREERKVVTVLFADLVGFTARAERLDPEEVRALQAPYWRHVRSELERYGGTVEKFIGDAVMALFGAPTAHEDDPERAVRAALAIRDWATEEGGLEVRIGVTTGEALVSLGARPEAGEGMASGDVVNTASRLQAAAPANGVLVDETTFRATRQAIDYEEAQRVEAKGKTDPIPVWEVMQARAVVGVELRPQTQLVGRQHERDLLIDALDRVKREASPQLVTLVGVPGIGKSRLVAELFVEVERAPELIYWRHGRSLPYGEGVAFWAFAEMVKAQAGILHGDPAETTALKLHEAVDQLIGEDDASWVEARLEPLIGLGDSAADLEESFAAWRRFVEALAEQRPTVLVFEDLHWADDDLLDFVDHLIDWTGGVPLLVVGTARPELLDRRPGWGGGKRNAFTVSLAPLDDVETAQLISSLLDRPLLPAETQNELLRRAGGNPLYAEQFVRMLSERADSEEVPETVQGIIAARLDALPADDKALLQDASVIGKVFWTGALQAVSGVEERDAEQALHRLERKEFVHRERRSSVAGDREFAFAHLLVRDVAYAQIPRAQRAERHRDAAEWLETLGRTEDRAELLAHHYLAALELAKASGVEMPEVAAKAPQALVDAGDRAHTLSSLTAAARFYAGALELLADGDPSRPDVALKLELTKSFLGDVDIDRAEWALGELVRRGDADKAAEAEAVLARYHYDRGEGAAAEKHAARAAELVSGLGSSRAKAFVLGEQARRAMLAWDREGTPIAREALTMAEELGLDELRAELLNTIGTERTFAGDPGGFAELELSLELAKALDRPSPVHRAYNNLAESYRRAGDFHESSRYLEERRRYAERFPIPSSLAWLDGEIAIEAYFTGDWGEVLAKGNALIAEAEAGTPHYLEGVCRILRSKIRRAAGQDAREDSDRAVQQARSIGDPQVLDPALAWKAVLLLDVGETDQASRLADEVLELFPNFYAIVDLAFVLHGLGRGDEIASWLSDYPYRPWRDAATAIGAGDFHGAAEALEPTGNVAEEVYCRLRSGTDADVRRALDFYRSVGATRYIREGEALLAASA